MRTSSKIALGVAVLLLAAAAVLFVAGSGPRATAEAQIGQALREAQEAAQQRSVGGVMKIVSDDYKDASNMNKDRLAAALLRSYHMARNSGIKYDVRVGKPDVRLDPKNPDEALVLTSISVVDTSNNQSLYGDSNTQLMLKMRREPGRRWLVLPDDKWRITSVVNLPPLPGLGGDEGGGASNPLGL